MGSNLFGWYFMDFGTKMFPFNQNTRNQGFDGDLPGVRPSIFDMVLCEDIGDFFRSWVLFRKDFWLEQHLAL